MTMTHLTLGGIQLGFKGGLIILAIITLIIMFSVYIGYADLKVYTWGLSLKF